MVLNLENAYLVLKKYLKESNPNKYEHSIRVAKTSGILAQKWGAPVSDAVIVALLHDIGKSMSKQQMLSLCVRNNITIYDFELFENITALHGRISALIFEEEFKENDKKRIELISHAISNHSTGSRNMNILDKIIFIADNLDLKEESTKLYEEVKSGNINNPDYYVKKIIEQKIHRSEKNRKQEYNPLLDDTIKGLEER